ncbi:MAG: MAPEG family protein [Pseudomonadota bacterium]
MSTQHALHIAAFYSALHILFFVALSLWVVRERTARKIGLGTGDDPEFTRLVRMHGHTAEYLAPILALLVLFVVLDIGTLATHLFGAVTLLGRVMHSAGLHKSPYRTLGRLGGMVLIMGALIIGSLAILIIPLAR